MKTQANDIAALAIVANGEQNGVITYGAAQFPLPINDNGDFVSIDASFLTGIKFRDGKPIASGTVKLKHINACLKEAGMEATDANKSWFNKNARDGYHKFLRHFNRVLIREGTPVSAGCSTRTIKKTGEKIMTGKVGYEICLNPTETKAKAIADKAAKSKKNSKRRASRQAKNGLVSVKDAVDIMAKSIQTATTTATPETVQR